MTTDSTPRSAQDSPRAGAGPASGRRRGMAGWLVAHRRGSVLVLLLGVLALTALRVIGGGTLIQGGVQASGSASARAEQALAGQFGIRPAGVVLVVESHGQPVTAPAAQAATRSLVARLHADPAVTAVRSYLDPGAARLRSVNAADGLVTATLAGDDATRATEAAAIASHFRSTSGPVTVAVTGTDVLAAETSHLTERGLLRAELLAFPIVLLLLGLYLRRALLALVPVAAGVLAVLSGLMLLGAVAAVTPVTSTATNLVVGLALGLCIDYALLLITRYREELRAGRDRDHALAAAVRRAGRTIVFSAAALAISLAALALFPVPFLRSMAIGGLGATLFAATCSLIVVPALLAALGDRVPARAPARPRQAPGWWYRFAAGVMRRPAAVALPVLAALAFLLLPVAHLHLGINDDRVLPASDPARQGAQVLRAAFDGRETSPLQVVATGAPRLNISPAALGSYAARLSRVRGVARVEAPAGTFTAGQQTSGPGPAERRMRAGNAAYLDVIPAVEPLSAAGSQLVTDVRAVPAPAPVLVGGPAADRADVSAAIISRLPAVLGLIAAVSFTALWLLFGSLLVPLIALVLSALSLSATFGAAVWIFQDGHLAGLLGFTPTGWITAPIPVLVFCVAFGLSMDYSMFVLSRIKEEHDRSGDLTGSVAAGLDRTGRIITFAAGVVAVVFAGFAASDVAPIKLLGLGLAIAVLLDAFIIRSTLLPAALRLAGPAAWWSPAPLARLHHRIGLSETALDHPATESRPQVTANR
jgi:putative drug exporter of the RND superfamily